MDLLTPDERRLQRICDLRRRVERDLSLGFLSNHFKHQIARSHKAVIAVVDLWQELVDAPLVEHTRLEGLSRGVLRVGVDSSAHLYQLDQLLRGGLQAQLLRRAASAQVRRIRLHLIPSLGAVDSNQRCEP